MAPTSQHHQIAPVARAALIALLLGLVLALPLPRAAAQMVAPDLPTYTAWVREALAAARRGDRIGLEEAGGRLVLVERVHLSDGESATVDNSWLSDELARPSPDMTLIADRLGALADALAQPPGTAPPDALDRLRAILENPPYDTPPPTPPPAWLTDLLSLLVRLLEALLSPVGGVAAGASWVAWAIGIIGLLLLLGVIGYLIRGLRRGIVREAPPSSADPEANLTARAAIEQAGTLARGGDYRSAVRYLYLGALLRLDERGLLRYDRALTNREYIERVRENPALRAALIPIVETFDRVWYGHALLDQTAFDAYRASVERLGRD